MVLYQLFCKIMRLKFLVWRLCLIGSKNSKVGDHLLKMKIVKVLLQQQLQSQIDAVHRMIEKDRRLTSSEIHATLGI